MRGPFLFGKEMALVRPSSMMGLAVISMVLFDRNHRQNRNQVCPSRVKVK